jgi:hypothetical protein
MSVQAMSWVLDYSNTTFGTRLVLLSIANHCDKFGTDAWPKLETIAQEAHLSLREVSYAIKNLVEMNEIEVEKGSGKIGRNKYTILPLHAKFAGEKTVLPANFAGEIQSLPAKYDISTCKVEHRNKEEPSLTVLKPCSPSSNPPKKEIKTDTRYSEFIEAINQGYKTRHWDFGFSAADGKQLKELLKVRPNWTVRDFRVALKNYFLSEGSVPGSLPRNYLARLPNFSHGPLDRFQKLKQKPAGVATVEEVNRIYAD